MKKQLLFALLILTTIFSFSQFSLSIDGTPVTDGHEIIVTTLDETADREFVFTNLNTTMPINTLVKVESITNSNGDHLTLCYDLCYYGVVEGNTYPQNGSIQIPANGSSSAHGNHFLNEGVGDDPSQPVIYVLKFIEVDVNGDEIGDAISITYKYNGVLATEDYNQVSFNLYPTVAKTNFTLEVNEKVNLQIFSIEGKLVKQVSVNEGENRINISNLSPQLYFAKITNQEGKISITKLIIK